MLKWIFLLSASVCSSLRTRASSETLEYEPALPNSSEYIGYDCSITDVTNVKEVCEICGAELAYIIPMLSTEYLEGYYEAELYLFDTIFADFSEVVPTGLQYAVAKKEETVCVAASELIDNANYTEIIEFFTGEETVDIAIPEIFKDINTQLSFVAARYTGEKYDYLSIDYTASGKAAVSDSTEYDLLRIYMSFYDEDLVVYTGVVNFESHEITDSVVLNITTKYTRKEHDDFVALLTWMNVHTTEEWNLVIDPNSDCNQIEPPYGVSSLLDFVALKSEQYFRYDAESGEIKLKNTISYFNIQDFAITPDIFLNDITGSFIIQSNSTCSFAITGTWIHLEYIIQLTLKSIGTSDYDGSGVFLNNSALTLSDIQEKFYYIFFPTDGDMIPEFKPENPEFINYIYETNMTSPYIHLYFLPEVSYNIFGMASTLEYIEFISGRVNTIVHTVIHLYSETKEILVSGNGMSEVNSDLIASSETILISENKHFTSLLRDGISIWNEGLRLLFYIEFDDSCADFDFCSLIQALISANEYWIEATIIGDTVHIDKDPVNFTISEDLQIEEAGLSVTLGGGQISLEISGALYLRVDSQTVLRFICRIVSDEDGNAVLEGGADSEWKDPLEVENLAATGMKIHGFVKSEGSLVDYTTTGLGYIGANCLENENCLAGIIDFYLDLDDYGKNNFTLSYLEIATLEFYNEILGYRFINETEIPLNMRCLAFPIGAIISHKYGGSEIDITGTGAFCGVLGMINGILPDLTSGKLSGEIDLYTFRFASNNFIYLDPIAVFTSSRETMENTGYFTGTLSGLAMTVPSVTIDIQNGYTSAFKGKLFKGIYEYTIELNGDANLSITDSVMELDILLRSKDLSTLERSSKRLVVDWISTGTNTLALSDQLLYEKAANLGILASKQCTEYSCPITSKCTNNVIKECVANATELVCAEGNGCEAIELQCTNTEILCVKQCEECECLSEVEVCKEWGSECNLNSSECKTQEIQVSDNCVDEVRYCEEGFSSDLACVMECEWEKALLKEASEDLEAYYKGYNETANDLAGFEILNALQAQDFNAGKLIVFSEIRGIRILNETKISENGNTFILKGKFISIKEEKLIEGDIEVNWNFHGHLINNENIFQGEKAFVINNSDQTMTDDLIIKVPAEVLAENIDYSEDFDIIGSTN